MKHRTRSSLATIVGTLLALALVASACGSSGSSGSKDSSGGGAKTATTDSKAAKPTGSPIVIGWVGTLTSATANSTLGHDSLDTWVQWTNDHGGIKGHPVVAKYKDDKADPAVGLAAVKDLVENEKVVAFVGDEAGSTEQTWASYVLEKRIPVIHDALIDAVWFTNPMFYPMGGTVITNIWGQMKAAKTAGANKVAVILCTENPACAQAQALFKADAEQVGLEHVYGTLASQTQASYTAECLAAKKAGAEAVAAFINAVVFSRDCARQGFKPFYINSGMGPTVATLKSAPDLGNTVGSSPDWLCLDETVAAGKDFYAALKKYHPEWAPGGSKREQGSQALCVGWVGGLGFTKALENAGVTATSAVTSEDVIKGLAMFKGETLGGLQAPITLSDGTKPNPQQKCVFLYQIKGTKLTSLPKAGEYSCQP
jgi:branched-chain amino acid transport system substrate-binding protein